MTRPLVAVVAEAADRITQAVNAKVIPAMPYMWLASDLHRAAHEIDDHMREETEKHWGPYCDRCGKRTDES